MDVSDEFATLSLNDGSLPGPWRSDKFPPIELGADFGGLFRIGGAPDDGLVIPGAKNAS
jgi:hypothetical protein